MATFDFVFTLIGLVLGLSLVEVLAGLARTLNARASTKIGWLTPLLGVFVILDVTSFWGICWSVRDMLPSVRLTLGAGVLFTSIYYMAATLVFPGHPEQFADSINIIGDSSARLSAWSFWCRSRCRSAASRWAGCGRQRLRCSTRRSCP